MPVPPQIRFWGIDSGITHSVGGSDYGAVRVGAFMGRTIIASIKAAQSPVSKEVHGASTATAESLHPAYLCNTSPSEWLQGLEDEVPVEIMGSEFLKRYTSHCDTATSIAPDTK